MTFWKWSQTAANNATSDSTCPFPEGMAPSALNDGTRGMMAAAAKYRDDIAGAIVTTGTSTGYIVSSNEGFDTLAHLGGQMMAFTPHVTCGSTVTLNVDGLGNKPLRSSPGVELSAGTLLQGTPYVATYNATDGAFYLHGFYGSPYGVPVGGMLPYLVSTAPNSSFALPFGQAISRANYASLFALIGNTFGVGDGATTFNIPDLRGRIPFGLDTMGGVASGRLTAAGGGVDGTTIGASGGAQNVTLSVANLPNANVPVAITDPGHVHAFTAYESGGGQFTSSGGGALSPQVINTSSARTGISASVNLNGGVTQTAMAVMPPSLIVPWILRVI